MAFWTNYDPTVSNTGIGDKSVTPNEFGYVLTGSYELGDALQAVSDLLITGSTNFSYSGSSITPGSTNDNQWLAVSYASGAVGQDYIFVVNSADADGNGAGVFRETIGDSSNATIGVGARDLQSINVINPEYWKEVHDQQTLGFFRRLNDAGSGIAWQSSNASTQDIRIFVWSNDDWLAFLFYYTDYGQYRHGQMMFRVSEPDDGHYVRVDGGVHGWLYLINSSIYSLELSTIKGNELSAVFLGLTTGESPSNPPIQMADGRELLVQGTILSRSGKGAFLGVIPGLYITRQNASISTFDTTVINGKEYIALAHPGRYIMWIQNET